MFRSILNDLENQMRNGNMITRLIIVNLVVWVVFALIKSFTPQFYGTLIQYFAIPGDLMTLLYRPWTIFTHAFVHSTFMHVFWNMVLLYWFGRIVGDLIGDKHVLPLFICGVLAGAVGYLLSYQMLPRIGAIAMGASAGVMAVTMAAGRVAPDYELNLLLIGRVRLKFVVLALILMDVIGAGSQVNTGGHIAHLAGVLMGWFFVGQMGSNYGLTERINGIINWIRNPFTTKTRTPKNKRHLKVSHKSEKLSPSTTPSGDQVDRILEKIKKSGFNSLTKKEREILAEASKE